MSNQGIWRFMIRLVKILFYHRHRQMNTKLMVAGAASSRFTHKFWYDLKVCARISYVGILMMLHQQSVTRELFRCKDNQFLHFFQVLGCYCFFFFFGAYFVDIFFSPLLKFDTDMRLLSFCSILISPFFTFYLIFADNQSSSKKHRIIYIKNFKIHMCFHIQNCASKVSELNPFF